MPNGQKRSMPLINTLGLPIENQRKLFRVAKLSIKEILVESCTSEHPAAVAVGQTVER